MTDDPTTPETPEMPDTSMPEAPDSTLRDSTLPDAPTASASANADADVNAAGPIAPESGGPSHTWMWIAGGLVAAVLAVFAVTSLTGGDDESSTPAGSSASAESQTYSGHGVTFNYPGDWQAFGPATFQVNSGNVLWSEAFGAEPGSSGTIVTEYVLQKDVGSVSGKELQAELQRLFDSTIEKANGELLQPLSPTTMNGLPAYQVSFTSVTGGVDLTTDMVLIFKDSQQWNIQCQYTAADQERVQPGCQEIWDTFAIEG